MIQLPVGIFCYVSIANRDLNVALHERKRLLNVALHERKRLRMSNAAASCCGRFCYNREQHLESTKMNAPAEDAAVAAR